ncbi:beta-ketoacyl-ACP synthase III [Paenibacillus dendritiformis]|uniref:beta-ketoacyl-ACP synthase III n=1 Tax=Paenibacillus TaxID=44249 RepID=UPI00248D301A|nr:beta-ketoacyl-ACP synthase III [Paenibacillus dendritiformis]WGU96155.1 beta-ketoacyl-ACP synthase III [Paenibacillus dendritiformis]
MHNRQVKLLASGKYLPKRKLTSADMDRLLGVPDGWVQKKSDVAVRHFIEDETASYMGAQAAREAIRQAGLRPGDIDCIVCASGTQEQPIPCNAALLQKELGPEWSGIPAFDMNSTCLSFLVALDVISYMIEASRYRRVLIVSSEIASTGLNWQDKQSAALFGDGAAAVIAVRAEETESSRIAHAAIRTYAAGAELSEIRGGGSRLHATACNGENRDDFLFRMDGQAIYRMASKLLPDFTKELLDAAGARMADFRLVIPHQGSAMAMRLLRRKLGIAEEQLLYITPNHGNTIAASIPMGLHEAMKQGRIRRGDRILLLGTSAGLTLGGMIIDY